VPNTPNGLPYPLISDPPATAKDIQNLATALDPSFLYAMAGRTVPSATNTSAAPAPTSGTFNTIPASTVLDHSGARVRVQGTAVKPSLTQHGEAVFTLAAGTWTAFPICFREPRNDGTGSSTGDQVLHPQCRVYDGGPA
jgi:hypothetical protein